MAKIIMEALIEGLNYRTSDKSWIVKAASNELSSESVSKLNELLKIGGFC